MLLEVVKKQLLPSLLRLPQVLVLEEVPDQAQFRRLHQWSLQSQWYLQNLLLPHLHQLHLSPQLHL